MKTTNYCPNCHYPLRPNAHYCHQCGQKRTNKRVTLGSLIGDFFSTLFNFDGKVFRTLGALFVPGKLTRAYFAGQHQRYVKPVRLFLALATVFLALLFWIIPNTDRNDGDITQLGTQLERSVEHHQQAVRMDTLRRRFAAGTDAETQRALDSLYFTFWANEREALTGDSTQLLTWTAIRDELSEAASDPTRLIRRAPSEDFITLSADSLANKYGYTHWLDRYLLNRQSRFLQSDENFNRFLINNLFWLFLFLPIVIAFIYKLLFWRRKRYYVEHLVFNLHFYSFLFIVVLLILPFRDHFPVLMPPLVIVLGGYLYMALRRVYQQGWIKTLVKQLLAFILLQFALIPVLALWILVNALIF